MRNFRDAALATGLVLALLLGFVCLAVWWMQTNFGAISALATVGSVLGAIFIYVGIRIGGQVQRTTMENFVDFNASVEETRGRQAALQREYARQDREQLAAYAKLQTIDVHRVNQLATQQARLLMDTERRGWDLQQQQQQQPAAAWAMDNDDASEGVRYYE